MNFYALQGMHKGTYCAKNYFKMESVNFHESQEQRLKMEKKCGY